METRPGPVAVPLAQARNENLIKGLEELLAEAKDGQINAIVYAKFRPDATFATGRYGSHSDLQIAGAVAFILHDLVASNYGAPVTPMPVA